MKVFKRRVRIIDNHVSPWRVSRRIIGAHEGDMVVLEFEDKTLRFAYQPSGGYPACSFCDICSSDSWCKVTSTDRGHGLCKKSYGLVLKSIDKMMEDI